jgi:hypothetical protein
MSFAIHIFMPNKFEQEPYLRFLDKIKNLYGQWQISEDSFNYDTHFPRIHDCFLTSDYLPSLEFVRVNVQASRRHEAILWPFSDYEWYISFETSASRSVLGLAVQVGSLLLATQRFPWTVIVDRDSGVEEDEKTEFRSFDALLPHVRKIFYPERRACLQGRGILNENGDLLLNVTPPSGSPATASACRQSGRQPQ